MKISSYQKKDIFVSIINRLNMKLNHYLLLVLSFFSFSLFSQNAKLSGKITDEVGEALISANVVIDASKGWAAVTDFDGNYSITNPPSGILRINGCDPYAQYMGINSVDYTGANIEAFLQSIANSTLTIKAN